MNELDAIILRLQGAKAAIALQEMNEGDVTSPTYTTAQFVEKALIDDAHQLLSELLR